MKLHVTRYAVLAAMVAPLAIATTAQATEHLWEINEVFSNADGTIQFIEMQNQFSSSGQNNQSRAFFTTDSGNRFDFPNNLPFFTAGRTFIAATNAFAALPNAPTPDYFIPEHFFDVNGDTIFYNAPNFGFIGELSFGSGDLPVDGIHSLFFDGTHTINSPKNIFNDTGSVVAPEPTVAMLLMAGTSALVWRRPQRR